MSDSSPSATVSNDREILISDAVRKLESFASAADTQSYERVSRILPTLLKQNDLLIPGISIEPEEIPRSILLQWPSRRLYLLVEPELLSVDWLERDQPHTAKCQTRELTSDEELFPLVSEILRLWDE